MTFFLSQLSSFVRKIMCFFNSKPFERDIVDNIQRKNANISVDTYADHSTIKPYVPLARQNSLTLKE